MTIEKIADNIVTSILSHPDCGKQLHKDKDTLIMVAAAHIAADLREMARSKKELERLMR